MRSREPRLDPQWHEQRQIIDPLRQCAEMAQAVTENAQDERERPQHSDTREAQHGAQRVHERLERDGGEDERERQDRSEEHTSELQSPCNLVCRLLLEKKKSSRK